MVIFISLILALILLIHFRTEGWVEYCRLLHLNFLSFYKDYDIKKSSDEFLTYHLYLRRYHNCFFVRMITCPVCLIIWLGILLFLVEVGIAIILASFAGIAGFIAIFLSAVFSWPIEIILGLIIFLIIDKLLG